MALLDLASASCLFGSQSNLGKTNETVVSRGRGCPLSSAGLHFGGVRCCQRVAYSERDISPALPISGQKRSIEELWRELFSNPSLWWDHRAEKVWARYPDFTHKKTQESLWRVNRSNPPWVEAELLSLAPGTVQSDLFSWNKRLERHLKAKEYEKTMTLFQQMQQEGMDPNTYTFVTVIKACTGLKALEEGKRLHAQTIKYGCESEIHVGSSLIDMYAKCGRIDDAYAVFERMTSHDVVSWTAMIVGYVKCGEGKKALELSHRMQEEGVEQNQVTFLGIVNACANVGALEEGRYVHEQIVRRGYGTDVFISSGLINMYSNCGSIEDARKVFNASSVRNVVTWNAMIQGCVKCGQGQEALELYHQMQCGEVKPDPITFVGVLNACAGTGNIEEGRQVHEQIIKRGFESALFIRSSLVDMYAKCGSIQDAAVLFNSMPAVDLGSWNAMISGFVKCGQGKRALDLYRRMREEMVMPDAITFIGVLNACASVAALGQGKAVHSQIIESGCEENAFVGSSLIDMYAKCGSIVDAQRVFKNMSNRRLSSWNAMLGGYAMHGLGREALEHFEEMRREKLEMDSSTFVSLLSACSHAGLVDEGLHLFESMSYVYNISAQVEHYSCLVDLLGRAGCLLEAENVIETMPFEANVTIWLSLLSACRVHGSVPLGERAAKEVLNLDPGNAPAYVLLSNIYAAAGKWNNKQNVQQMRLKMGVHKEQGMTWIEINGEVHSFRVDDQEHPRIGEIQVELNRLHTKMKEAGYVPDLSFALHDLDDKGKTRHLWSHSEKLAVAFGLISTPAASSIRIYKNLRICGDCHTAIKFIAKIVGREIIVRDTYRFHCFKDGACSCRDCW